MLKQDIDTYENKVGHLAVELKNYDREIVDLEEENEELEEICEDLEKETHLERLKYEAQQAALAKNEKEMNDLLMELDEKEDELGMVK